MRYYELGRGVICADLNILFFKMKSGLLCMKNEKLRYGFGPGNLLAKVIKIRKNPYNPRHLCSIKSYQLFKQQLISLYCLCNSLI